MKHLILMRHAKAEKDQPVGGDFERDLEMRGRKDASEMAQALLKTKHRPDFVIASPAKRTFKTAQIVSKELKLKEDKLELDSHIYNASIHDLVHVIRELNDVWNTVLLVGHNPAITGLIGYLTPTFVEHVPTSGIVVVMFEEKTWKLTQTRSGKVVWHINPKGLSLM